MNIHQLAEIVREYAAKPGAPHYAKEAIKAYDEEQDAKIKALMAENDATKAEREERYG